MARRKGAPKRTEQPNRYRMLDDAQLADVWERMKDDRADRLEYFAALPDWQVPANVKLMKDDPESWGLSRGEFNEWCAAILEHWREGFDMADAAKERHRRLYEAERRRLSALPYPESHEEYERAYEPLHPPVARWKLDAETMREYIERTEARDDQFWKRLGAGQGWWDAFQEWHRSGAWLDWEGRQKWQR